MPADFPLGSLESRAAARAKLERSQRDPANRISVRIIHIGHNGKEPLPPSQSISWQGGVTEIIHVSGGDS